MNEAEKLEARFRPCSVQLQDSECNRLVHGMYVCASHSSGPDDLRFYDAFVEEVQHYEHAFQRGVEECLCAIILFWQNGPNAGNLTTTGVGNICLVQPTKKLHSVVASFLKMVTEMVEMSSCDYSLNSREIHRCEVRNKYGERSSVTNKFSFHQSLQQEQRYARQSASKTSLSEDRSLSYHDRRLQDLDLGGVRYQHMLLLGNIEKTLSPASVAKFLHRKTSIKPQVYIYPSLSSELFAKGAVLLDCEESLLKLCDFLENPRHFIVSSTGRPLVILEKILWFNRSQKLAPTLLPVLQEKGSGMSSNDLKVVESGTREYRIAEGLKYLFTEFSRHQEKLHMRLGIEEGKILSSPY